MTVSPNSSASGATNPSVSLSLAVNLSEEFPNALHVVHGSEFLERIDSAQSMLSVPKQSLHPHRVSQKVRSW